MFPVTMADKKTMLEILFSKLDVEHRVYFERVSVNAGVAVNDSWLKKKSLTKKDSGWLLIPGPKRCEIISKMSSLTVVDVEHAVEEAKGFEDKIVDKLIKSCPAIRRIYNDTVSNMTWKYWKKYGAECRIEMIDGYNFHPSDLRSFKNKRPSLLIEWSHNNIKAIPELTTHLSSGHKFPLDILTDCDPIRLKHLQSICLNGQLISSEQIEHLCSKYRTLKEFSFSTNVPTTIVTKHLMKLECLEVLDYGTDGSSNLITSSIFDYLKSEQASKLESLVLDTTSFPIRDFVDIISANLKRLKVVEVSAFSGLILRYTKKSLMIKWTEITLSQLFKSFPKAYEFLIHAPGPIHRHWFAESKIFSDARRKKLIKVVIDLKNKSPRKIEETENLIFMNT